MSNVFPVDQSTLFRRNSLASKILSAYSKLIGTPYIVDTLLDIMQETCSERLEDYEVDRNKMPALTDDQLLVNANRLVRLTDKYLSAVLRTKDLCPAYVALRSFVFREGATLCAACVSSLVDARLMRQWRGSVFSAV